VDILLDVLSDFPFADQASLAHALALLFTILMRSVIDGHVPLNVVVAPVQGTGKSLLVSTIGSIAVGNVASESIPGKENEDEWRKKITSILLAAFPLVTLDNIPDNTTIKSPSLAAALTSREWSDRRLGSNETIRVASRSVWVATGNNLRTAGDIPRRSYTTLLDANVERPWTRRDFKIPDLEQYVLINRGNLLGAAYTIMRAWHTNGRPKAEVPRFGSFQQWADIIGAVLAFMGIEGFLTNLEQTQIIQDEDTQQWTAFFAEWWREFEDRPTAAADLAKLILPRKDGCDDTKHPIQDALPEPLLINRDRGEGSLKRSLGRNLSRLTGRIFEQRKLSSAGIDGKKHVRMWRLEALEEDHVVTEENTACSRDF
jgi:hypothetical protein